MSTCFYSDERNVQILVALLKSYGIKYIVASPGTTNINFVWSVQYDPFFTVFSAVDERHAAYLACGIASEKNEPVVITCTGATASRNYLPALTEAYYRKLPILAVTATQKLTRIGNLIPQVLDRTSPPADAVVFSTQCTIPRNEVEEKACELAVNKALIALKRHGGGPVHINLETSYSSTYSQEVLPSARHIQYITPESEAWPQLPENVKVGVWIGAHTRFSAEEEDALEAFVYAHDAVVFTDKTSHYQGAGCINASLLCSQGIRRNPQYENLWPELIIHIGEVSGDYPTAGALDNLADVWRISEDGELKDTLGRLVAVFEMPELSFWKHYTTARRKELSYVCAWERADRELREKIPDLPFSNPWIAQQLAPRLPVGSALHLGILNSLRSWNLFSVARGVEGSCNVGGFGIDGIVSTAMGASLVAPEKLFFIVVGDLAFFYDLNALGNRHIGKNLRLLLINNASGSEFHIYSHPGAKFGPKSGDYIAADGHFGNHSRRLVRHYAEDLGFKYLSADSKDSFRHSLNEFLKPSDRSILLECFTLPEDESEAQYRLNTIEPLPESLRHAVSKVLPTGVKSVLKKVIR